jgi:glutamate/tyrosine decarboxylase-like PLP-dependent enzyme
MRPVPEGEFAEESLDPQEWESLRVLGHQMVDDMLGYLRTVRDRPVWRPMPDDVRASFKAPLPRRPQKPEEIYREFQDRVLPYPMGNIHPRFWGWVIGTGTPLGMLAEMLAAGMNPNTGGFDDSASLVEDQVLDWLKEMLGYPAESSGLLVSGGSMANLIGLAVARNAKADFDVRREGLQGAYPAMTFYASDQTHSSVRKAVEVLGIGSEALRLVPTREDFSIDVNALENAIDEDRKAGRRPVCVIGNAGTVDQGVIDDLEALADLSASQDLWLHVDGAFGALAALCPGLRGRLKGMERADSLAFDLHKWMYMPYEVGGVLVRHEVDHRATFSLIPPYLKPAKRGLTARPSFFGEYGIQLSRSFRALKVWMSLKEHGVEKYGRLIQQNVDQAQYLAGLVEGDPELELVATGPLNLVCFRFVASSLNDADLDELNKEILVRLHESGVAVPSSTRLRDKFCLRVAITNHRTRRGDLDLLVENVIQLGRELLTARQA